MTTGTEQGLGAAAGVVVITFVGAFLRASLVRQKQESDANIDRQAKELDATLRERAAIMARCFGNGNGDGGGALGRLEERVELLVAGQAQALESAEKLRVDVNALPCQDPNWVPSGCPHMKEG